MSDEMTRDDLLTLMRAWGWTLDHQTEAFQVWASPDQWAPSALVPADPSRSDYERRLRQAVHSLAVAEAPRLLGVVREVARLHRPLTIGRETTCSTCRNLFGSLVAWPCLTARALEALTETTEEPTDD